MNVDSVNSANLYATKTDGVQCKDETESVFSDILENTCSRIGFAKRADTVSSYVSELSDRAQAYLEELKKRFGDTDFIIADFATEEQARELLKNGTGNYNCVMTPGLLEEMAADDDVRAEYEALIEGANRDIDKVREALSDAEPVIESLGFIFTDGCVKYFASIVRDDNTYDISAGTIDELIEKLSNPDIYSEEYDIHLEYYEKMAVSFGI